MHFTTYEFIAFFAVILIFNSLGALLNTGFRKISLIVFSYYFYYLFNFEFILFLLAISIITFVFSTILTNRLFTFRKIFLSLGILSILSVLVALKYFDFIITSLSTYFPQILQSITLVDIITPIGISYISFKSISLIIDTYRGTVSSVKLVDVFLYLSFFPQLLAGPIERYNGLISQISLTNLSNIDFSKYAFRFCWGVFKKLIIVSALFSNDLMSIFQIPEKYSAIDLLLGIYLFSAYIFIDFSGYTDISNGLSGMLGIKCGENFNKPYSASSISEFWKKWHISLSNWIRDYVYIPLGGNRVGKFRNYLNLIIAMTLAGIWHGANLNFLIWGFLHGLLIVLSRISLFGNRFKFVGVFITFNLISLLWIFFNTESLDVAFEYFKGLINFNSDYILLSYANIALLIIAIIIHNYEDQVISIVSIFINRFRFFYQGIFLGIILWLVFELAPETTPFFIYYQF
ncbi:MBOAT family protein [Candidatus Dojkabacteria bacterium]|nr:MBOAT family protein [Candidatus Dojkabacteria bacterium]